MDRLLFEAYASLQSNRYNNELEEYLCKELKLPKNFLTDHYYQISEKANQVARGNYKVYLDVIYDEYMKLLIELEERK